MHTKFPYPCGVVEEAHEVIQAHERSDKGQSKAPGQSFLMELVHHGYLLALTSKDATALLSAWDRARHRSLELVSRYNTLGNEGSGVHSFPMLDGTKCIGAMVHFDRSDRNGFLSAMCFITTDVSERCLQWFAQVLQLRRDVILTYDCDQDAMSARVLELASFQRKEVGDGVCHWAFNEGTSDDEPFFDVDTLYCSCSICS